MQLDWNYNTHYHRWVLSVMPQPCGHALDVGCGEGALTRQIASFADEVTAIDRSSACIDNAHTNETDDTIEYVLGDFLTFPLAPASFDFIASIAALHHMDEELALRRMSNLLKPGGTLAIIGLGKSRYPADLPRDAFSVVFDGAHRLGTGYKESMAPQLSPVHSYDELRRMAARLLPGCHFTRRLLWRYSLVWVKPGQAP
ncbi:MAG TPA: class I SAM-dependent methyltransferase [Solirubrobacteraceae bacterium]|nr:class I SAM-dependent methyltransferase [Solirubrobacteraceae bacterium]